MILPAMFGSVVSGISVIANTSQSAEEITCTMTGTFKDKSVEAKRESVYGKIADKDLVNAVLGIYHLNRSIDLNKTTKEINKLIEHVKIYEMDNDVVLDFDVGTYIQAYKFGTDYLDYLIKNKKDNSLAIAKEYQNMEQNKDKFSEYDYQYFSMALTGISDQCAVGTDGFPVDKKTYTINGVFPHYPDGSFHAGLDLVVPTGTKTYAIADGEVMYISTQCPVGYLGSTCGANGFSGGGNYVYYKVKNANGTYSVDHCHLSKVYVKVGDKIVKGQLIGLTGASGNASGAHLHLEIHKNVIPADLGKNTNLINPCDFIEGLCDKKNQAERK